MFEPLTRHIDDNKKSPKSNELYKLKLKRNVGKEKDQKPVVLQKIEELERRLGFLNTLE
jgi:hypothetical protein